MVRFLRRHSFLVPTFQRSSFSGLVWLPALFVVLGACSAAHVRAPPLRGCRSGGKRASVGSGNCTYSTCRMIIVMLRLDGWADRAGGLLMSHSSVRGSRSGLMYACVSWMYKDTHPSSSHDEQEDILGLNSQLAVGFVLTSPPAPFFLRQMVSSGADPLDAARWTVAVSDRATAIASGKHGWMGSETLPRAPVASQSVEDNLSVREHAVAVASCCSWLGAGVSGG